MAKIGRALMCLALIANLTAPPAHADMYTCPNQMHVWDPSQCPPANGSSGGGGPYGFPGGGGSGGGSGGLLGIVHSLTGGLL